MMFIDLEGIFDRVPRKIVGNSLFEKRDKKVIECSNKKTTATTSAET